ncbi:hypothetical protein [Aquimarina intermedia]|uniref:Uncharacterized protein n=1 Tax=Aquimarina intermedia TaxID=350814 RepID=A0A5S5CBZ0_9FLAO|nr:hypothetical protein [Aquimarina intermedia]TYP76857.1 hypothetical protein BD809_1012 [Aquimarina intermedia]
MENFKFFKENIEYLNEKINEFEGFDTEISKFVLELCSEIPSVKIDFNKSYIKVKDHNINGGFFFKLISNHNNLKIEISLFRNYIEMMIDDNCYIVYDSFLVKNKNKIKEKISDFFHQTIEKQTLYYGTDIKKVSFFYRSENDRLIFIHKTENLKYFFKRASDVQIAHFSNWIDCNFIGLPPA